MKIVNPVNSPTILTTYESEVNSVWVTELEYNKETDTISIINILSKYY